MPTLRSVATATPPNRMPQAELRAVAEALLPDTPGKATVLEMFSNARIDARALARPVEWYLEPHGFKERTAAYVEVGLALVEEAATAALAEAGLAPADVRGIVLVSTTGLATPSLDARLMNRLPFAAGTVRLPVWGLGCAGGVAGLTRACELATARNGPVLLVALELCTLMFDVEQALRPGGAGGPDKKALVAASLFGDGCAAAVVAPGDEGVARMVANASHLFPDSERVMGWDVEDHNLDVVLSPRIPDIVREEAAALVAAFTQGRRPDEWVLHPGGAKVVDAYRDALGLDAHALRHTEAVLRRHGNMSSPTVLFALEEALGAGALRGGRTALLAALGPGFASEMALLQGT